MNPKIVLRKPQKNDAKQIVNLIKIGGTLDLNSEYLYLLQCTHFQDTCCVALYEDQIIGFVSGYRIPNETEKLFIWQVAVNSAFRGQNLAMNLILDITKRQTLPIHYIISTVSPSNSASARVFEKVAHFFKTTLTYNTLFAIDDFLDAHEEEVQFCIGPFNKQ